MRQLEWRRNASDKCNWHKLNINSNQILVPLTDVQQATSAHPAMNAATQATSAATLAAALIAAAARTQTETNTMYSDEQSKKTGQHCHSILGKAI